MPPTNTRINNMGSFVDFVNSIETDMSIKIFMCLDDPADMVRISSVSRSWRQFVIVHGLSKQLCLKMFPQLSRITRVIELDKVEEKPPIEAGSSCAREQEARETDHRVFAYLSWACKPASVVGCISEAISASSTDNYPEESIENTLEPRDIVARRAMYWSSKGHSNPAVPETLIYKLASQLCIVSEINIRPFEAFFQMGAPIYSAKAVRFRLGHPKSSDSMDEHLEKASHDPNDDKFVWTYTSPEFPMSQENRLQNFKLPEPVLCIGGILQIELLGRVQRQEMDGLYYICISYAQVMGRSLSPVFGVEILEPSGTCMLRYDDKAKSNAKTSSSGNDVDMNSGTDYLQRRVRDLQQIVNILQGHVGAYEEFEVDEEEEDGVL